VLKAKRVDVRKALPLLREAVASRKLNLALQLAESIATARRAKAEQLMDAARALGRTQQFPVQRHLWARAYKSRSPSWLRARIAEGYADALLTSDSTKEAGKVIRSGLKRASLGTRRGLLERLVAWGKLSGNTDEVRDLLLRYRDPDAYVLAARLVGEIEGDEAGLAVLRKAWKRFAGHRWLQAEYLKVLGRLGFREELEKAVARVVRLSPADPMPFVQVLDAHIAVRDVRKARKLIDHLAGRYPRHHVLIEALIDREQRIGDDHKRIARLYRSLLKAGGRQATYVEAFAEWLLTRGNKQHAEALAVLAKLTSMLGKLKGQQRAARILQAHGFMAEAQGILLKLEQQYPKERDIKRQLASLYGQIGRLHEAEKRWRGLSRLNKGADMDRRQLAAEARRNLVVIYRKRGWGPPLKELARAIRSGQATLGDVLLFLDVRRGSVDAGFAIKHQHRAVALGLNAWDHDAEVLQRFASTRLREGRRAEALAVLKKLDEKQPDLARHMLAVLIESALAAGDAKQAGEAEKLLLTERHATTTMLLKLGNLRQRHGDRKGAAELYRRASVRNPRDTRAMYRLAQLYRQAGDAAGEGHALREIVMRTSDSDELEKAGQRLLTLAMASGSCADLLRWLDAITPRHSRRSILQRFRLLAYDAWLRTEPLERSLRTDRGATPRPALLSEALTGGDLAMKVRALRQIARSGRPIPASLARRLLKDNNAVVRRDTALALGASGTPGAAKLLIEMEEERSDAVVVAQLLAFGRLPKLPEAMPFLDSRLGEKRTHWQELASLALGRVGEPVIIPRLIRKMSSTRMNKGAVAVALGNLVGLYPEHGRAEEVVASLAANTVPTDRDARYRRHMHAYAAMWGLAATGRKDAQMVLLSRATATRSTTLRRLALRLAAASKRPSLQPDLWDVPLRWNTRQAVSTKLLRKLLTPWLSPDPIAERKALARFDDALAELLNVDSAIATPDSAGGRWCRGFANALKDAPRLKRWCATALRSHARARISKPVIAVLPAG